MPSQIQERRLLRKQSVRVDAGVVVTADAALGERVNELAVHASGKPSAELLTHVRANRLFVIVVVVHQAAVMLHEAGQVEVRSAWCGASKRGDSLVVERMLAVELLLIVVAFVGRGAEARRVEAGRVHFCAGTEAADTDLVGDRRASEPLSEVECGLSGLSLFGRDYDHAIGSSRAVDRAG